MTPSVLRYQASREWMEGEILAGQPVQHRRHALPVDPHDLEAEERVRVEAVLDAVEVAREDGRVTVLDSGIDPGMSYGPSEDALVPMDQPITQVVGKLPELPEPTNDLSRVLDVWEEWISRYCEEALTAIDVLNREKPSGQNPFGRAVKWGGLRVLFGPGAETAVKPEDGAEAMRDVRAGWAWTWAAKERFGLESVEAAEEATMPAPAQSQEWIESLGPVEIARRFLERVKKMHAAAKAHDAARKAQEPDFDIEMGQWASAHGSTRLQLGIEDGYRMNARYLAERLAAEAPGFFAMSVNSAKRTWARRTASPSEQALLLRRRVQAAIEQSAPLLSGGSPEVEIMTIAEPPPQMYLAHVEGGEASDFPSKEGWPWWYDEEGNAYGFRAKPFEAIVVTNWLGRFHLVGAVADESGSSPAGIWAVPQLRHYREDGVVERQNPDGPAGTRAKRKPPSPGEDDIPF